jgi:hypothetical protein
VRGGTTTEGVFLFSGGDEAAVLRSDAVPSPFGPGSAYRKLFDKLFESIRASRSGTWVAFTARVKDTSLPRIPSVSSAARACRWRRASSHSIVVG